MKKIILASVVSTILVGCGGSDGGSSAPSVEKPLPTKPNNNVDDEMSSVFPPLVLDPSKPLPTKPNDNVDDEMTGPSPSFPLIPSTPTVTIEEIADILDEPVGKLENLFDNKSFKYFLKEDKTPVIQFSFTGGYVIYDVMGSTVTHFLELYGTAGTNVDLGSVSLSYGDQSDIVGEQLNFFKKVGKHYQTNFTLPYTTETLWKSSKGVRINYTYTIGDASADTFDVANGIGHATKEERNYLLSIIKKFSDVPMTDLVPSTPPTQEQQFADLTGFPVEVIEELVEGEQHLSVNVQEGMPYIFMTETHLGFNMYTYKFDLMNGTVDVSAHETWEHDHQSNYHGMAFQKVTLNGTEIDYSNIGDVRWTVFNGLLTTLTELSLSKEVVENLFDGTYRLDYFLTPYNPLPYLVTGHIETSTLFLSEEKRKTLKEIVTNYITK